MNINNNKCMTKMYIHKNNTGIFVLKINKYDTLDHKSVILHYLIGRIKEICIYYRIF